MTALIHQTSHQKYKILLILNISFTSPLQTTFLNFTYFLSYNRANLIGAGDLHFFGMRHLLTMAMTKLYSWCYGIICLFTSDNNVCESLEVITISMNDNNASIFCPGLWPEGILATGGRRWLLWKDLYLHYFDIISVRNKLRFWFTLCSFQSPFRDDLDSPALHPIYIVCQAN